jgi:hypothetical protein
MSQKPISPLRQRMLEDMSLRGFTPDTQRDYIRAVKKLAAFLGRSPDTGVPKEQRWYTRKSSAANIPTPALRCTQRLADPCELVIGKEPLTFLLRKALDAGAGIIPAQLPLGRGEVEHP